MTTGIVFVKTIAAEWYKKVCSYGLQDGCRKYRELNQAGC